MDGFQKKGMLRFNFTVLISVFLLIPTPSMVYAEEAFTIDSVDDFLKRSEELKGKIKIPENIHNPQAAESAQKTYQHYLSEEFQEKLLKETQRLKEDIFREPLREYYSDIKKATLRSTLPQDERLYIFISSSLPIQTLRNYASRLDKLKDPHIVMIMRGFVGGAKYIKPTLEFIQKILKKSPDCSGECEMYSVSVEIDPLLFSRYGIKKVPAVVYVRGLSLLDKDMSEAVTENARVSDYYVVYGDASLEYILEVIYKETKSKSIENTLASLKEGFYR